MSARFFASLGGRSLLLLIVWTLGAVLPAAAVTVPDAPLLRIEAGGHLSLISRVSADRAGRYLVTGSEDKTIRIWSAQTGQMLNVLRPPVGPESLGSVYAAEVSPDGELVAAGGNSGFEPDAHALYLFERVGGEIREKGTLNGLEAPLQQLAWSDDGALVAVGLRQTGIRVFNRALGFVGLDEEYNDAVYGLDFGPDGLLAAVSLDGALRIYQYADGRFGRAMRKVLTGVPYSVAFSPDGSQVAIGYADRARIEVLSLPDLATVFEINRSSRGNLGRVAWRADGRKVLAAGTYHEQGRFPLLSVDVATRRVTTFAGFDNTVTSLAALDDGRIVAASAEPSWRLFDGEGRELLRQDRRNGDFRAAGDRFRVSHDGRQVMFPMRYGGAEAVTFDSRIGELVTVDEKALSPARQRARGLAVTDWRDHGQPMLNGQPLPLGPREVSRSLAIAPDERGLVLGTEWHLRGFDRSGSTRWATRTPAPVWATAFSGDGRWVVAALGDGTIRWYRPGDGAEQLALFVHGDRRHWLLWTPEGYYDTSVGGEWLIGWHVNQAFNRAAQFFPVGRFRAHYYRPDLISRTFAVGDVSQALAQAPEPSRDSAPPVREEAPDVREVLPPRIVLRTDAEIVTDATQVPVRFALDVPADAPAESVRVRVDGKLVRTLDQGSLPRSRGTRDAAELEVPVEVPAGRDASVVVLASNRHGAAEPVTIRVRRPVSAGPPVGQPSLVAGGGIRYKTLYVFAAGISRYPNLPADAQLVFPSKDARDFVSAIGHEQARKLYDKAEVRVLSDNEATRAAVIDGLRWLRESVGPDDLAVLFLAGHGFMLENRYYFAPVDLDLTTETSGQSSSVPGQEIQQTLAKLRGRGVFFLDTCHSGFALSELRFNTNMTGALNAMDEEKGVVVLAGSAGRQLANEADEWGNGAFTKAILEGLEGRADYARTGRITPPLLHTYVSGRVKEMTENQQTPKMVGAVFDEPIAVVRQ